MRREIEGLVAAQLEKFLGTLRLPTREELEVVQKMAAKAREENEKLESRLALLEQRLVEHTHR